MSETAMEKAKTEVARKQITTVWEYFKEREDEIAAVLPEHITLKRMIGVMANTIKANPDIRNASQASLIAAVIQTVQNGLEPGNLGHCYYVTFNNKKRDGTVVKEVQFIMGYRGIIELVNNAGKAVILSTECVYKNDHFEYAQGLNPVLVHVPAKGDRGDLIGVYCTAKNLVANEKIFVFLAKEEIDKVRKASRAGSSPYSPWTNWYEEMAKKTAVKRIAKLLPLSISVQRAISTDETTKTRIDKDMAALPDETNYLPPPENAPAQVVEVGAGDLTDEEKEEILRSEREAEARERANEHKRNYPDPENPEGPKIEGEEPKKRTKRN